MDGCHLHQLSLQDHRPHRLASLDYGRRPCKQQTELQLHMCVVNSLCVISTYHLSQQVSHFISASDVTPQNKVQQPNFADFSLFREEVSITSRFYLKLFSLLCFSVFCSRRQNRLCRREKKKSAGRLKIPSQTVSVSTPSPPPPPSQMLHRKSATGVVFVKYMSLYFKTPFQVGSPVHSRRARAWGIYLWVKWHVVNLLSALFNRSVFVLHVSFPTLFIHSSGRMLV